MLPLSLRGDAAHAALRALNTVALASGPLDPGEAALLAQHAELFEASSEGLTAIEPESLAAAVTDPAERASLVQRLVLMAMSSGSLDSDKIAVVRSLAKALRVNEPAIHQMEMFLADRIKLLAFDLGRRSFVGTKIKRVWREEGIRGLLEIGRAVRGVPDPERAARYEALGDLPEGTLGKVMHTHLRDNGYALPGEEKGTPEVLLFHDLGHALTGFGTSPEEELRMAGFEAGYMGEDGFSITVFALFQFHLGAALAPGAEPTTGRFALAPYRDAFHLGQACREDLRWWDPWPHFAQPVPEVRATLGLPATQTLGLPATQA